MKLKDSIRYVGDFLEVKRCRRKMQPPPSILFPLIWITGKCNLKCKMCDQWLEEKQPVDELSTKEWLEVIDSACNLRAAIILITGGEPFLRADIFDILGYIRRKGLSSHICTNGTLLNESVVEKLKSSGLDSISVSLDSHIPEVYNIIRGAHVFDDVVNGIKILRKGIPRLKIGINCFISKSNFKDIYKMVPYAQSLGVDQIKFDTIHTHLRHRKKSLTNVDELLFSEKDLPELSQEMHKLLTTFSKSRLLTNSRTFINGIIHAYNGKTHPWGCFAGYVSCTIDPSGKVTPCDNTDSGLDVRKNTLEEIWNSERFQELRNNVHNCSLACWDSTHAELNIRCARWGLFREFKQIARELNFYC
ncbi:MAG: radical SAM protein [Candidatus Omnitrophica bacterium]|nr:radical SAM protein [Candidatus Omnitrophota bacterium]